MKPLLPLRLCPFLLSSLLWTLPASAYPGKIALAQPVEGIAIDGDLSDWPANLIPYPILHKDDGDPLKGPDDFKGHFRVGYSPSENALYVAVEIQDDSVVRRSLGGQPWRAQDGCEVYLFGHRPGEGAPVQYRLWGEERGMYGPGSTEDMQVQVRWGERGYQYEWRIDIGRASGRRVRLGPDLTLGFDLSIWDRDADGTASWIAWSQGAGKYQRADRLGNLVLAGPGMDVPQIVERIGELAEGRIGPLPVRLPLAPSYQMFFSGVLLAFTFLHLLLFLFERQTRANLYYALYTGAIGAAIFSGLQLEFQLYMDPALLRLLRELALLLIGIIGLFFLYSLFGPAPRRFWWALIFLVLPVLAGVLVLHQTDLLSIPWLHDLHRLAIRFLSVGALVETFIVLLKAVRRRREGAWLIGIGFTVFALNISSVVFASRIDIADLYWVLIPLVSMSVYLARAVARTHQELSARLKEVEELSGRTQEQYEKIQEQNRQIQETNRQLDESNRALSAANKELFALNRELQQANERVQQASLHKSQFLARMSHDVRTPMNAIIGYTRILLRKVQGQIDPRQYQNLENIQLSATHLLALINDILDLSKIEAGRIDLKPESVDLAQLAAECAATVESLLKPGVELRRECAELPPLHTDADRVRRVLMNLLSNAVKFTEQGSITISLKPVDGWVEMAVADTGIGIPATELPHIFEEFRQVQPKGGSRQEGTGLGLAIVKKSVEMLGGTIAAESQVGKGTKFTLRLRDYQG